MARAIEIEGVPGPGRIGRVAIGDVLHRAARRFPDKVALADAGKHTTYRELDQMANRCANYFLSRGLQKGDKVSTICSNSTAFAAVSVRLPQGRPGLGAEADFREGVAAFFERRPAKFGS